MTATRLHPFGTTIFTEMSALATRTGAINLGQGFPDTDGPPEMLAADAPLAWAAVGTAASRNARTSMARTRRCMVGLLPGDPETRLPNTGRGGLVPVSCGRRAWGCRPGSG